MQSEEGSSAPRPDIASGVPPVVDDLMVVQNVFHAASIFFDYEENPAYYTERPVTMFTPRMDGERVKFDVRTGNISMLDGREVTELVSDIDYERVSTALQHIATSFEANIDRYSATPRSRPDVIAKLQDRFGTLQRMALSIHEQESDGTDNGELKDQKLLFLYRLNYVFKNDQGNSMEYPFYCLHFFQSQL
jgi:hypothetical protein